MIDTTTPAPGPWRMPNDNERRCRVYFDRPFRDCVDVCEVNPDLEETTDATMRVICAAPDIARELRSLVRQLEITSNTTIDLTPARRALAKLNP